MKARASIVYLLALSLVLATGSPEALAENDPEEQSSQSGVDGDDGKDGNADKPGDKKLRRGSRRARKRARALFKKGQRLVRDKQFDKGIAAIQSAYTLDPRMDHLYNLAVAYHLKGDKLVALEYYRKVARDGKKKKLVRLASRFVRELEVELGVSSKPEGDKEGEKEEDEGEAVADGESEQGELRVALREAEDAREKSDQAAEVARARIEDLETELEASRKREAGIVASRDRTLEQSRSRGGGRGKRIIGSTLMLAGGASLGVAGAYALVARQANNEIEGLEPGEDEFQPGVQEIGEDADQRLLIFSIAGGVAFTAGAVIYLLGERGAGAPDRDEGPEDLSIAPAIGPDSAGIQVFGRF